MKYNKEKIISKLIPISIIFIIFLISRLLVMGSIYFSHNNPINIIYFRWFSNNAKIEVPFQINNLIIDVVSPQEQNIKLFFNEELLTEFKLVQGRYTQFFEFKNNKKDNNLIRLESDFVFIPPNDPRELSYQVYNMYINGDLSKNLIINLNNTQGIHGREIHPKELKSIKQTLREGLKKWDASWYTSIIEKGYQWDGDTTRSQNKAFLYLFPFLSYLLKIFTGLDSFVVGVIVNNLMVFISMILLYFISYLNTEDKMKSYTGVILLAFNPFAVFTVSSFCEGTFMAATAFSILFLYKRRYGMFAIAGGAMNATRQNGLIAPIVLIIDYFFIEKNKVNLKNIIKILFYSLLSLWGFIIDLLYNKIKFNDFFATYNAHRAWGTIGGEQSMRIFFDYIFTPFNFKVLDPNFISVVLLYTIVIFTIIYIAKNKFIINRLDKILLLFCYGILSLIVIAVMPKTNPNTLGRLILTLFPILAIIAKTEKIHYKYIICTIIAIFVFYMFISTTRFSFGLPPV